MRRAGHTWVKGADDFHDLERLLGVSNMRVHHRELIGAMRTCCIARAGIPRRRNDALVVRDLLILDGNPVGKRAARRLVKPNPLTLFWPCLRIPMLVVDGVKIAALDVRNELVEEEPLDFGIQLYIERTRRRAADHCWKPLLWTMLEHL